MLSNKQEFIEVTRVGTDGCTELRIGHYRFTFGQDDAIMIGQAMIESAAPLVVLS
jgi:hypothetical protein